MKKLVGFLTVLALLALMGCKEEKAEAQKPVADTTKVVSPAPAKAPEAVKAPEAKDLEAAKPAAATTTSKSKKK